MEKDEIQNLIDENIKKAMSFSVPKYGDTPIDALQLVPKKYVDNIPTATTYAGYVNLDGSAGNLPAGWSSATTGTGQYTVTHNLANANYTSIAMAFGTSAFCKFNAVNANDVQFVFLDHTASLADTRFYFILIPF